MHVFSLTLLCQVPLCEVLSRDIILVSSGSVTKQKCSLKVPITSPNSPHFTCGYLHCVLTLEDHGSIQLSTENEKHARKDYHTSADVTRMCKLTVWYYGLSTLEVCSFVCLSQCVVRPSRLCSKYIHVSDISWKFKRYYACVELPHYANIIS